MARYSSTVSVPPDLASEESKGSASVSLDRARPGHPGDTTSAPYHVVDDEQRLEDDLDVGFAQLPGEGRAEVRDGRRVGLGGRDDGAVEGRTGRADGPARRQPAERQERGTAGAARTRGTARAQARIVSMSALRISRQPTYLGLRRALLGRARFLEGGGDDHRPVEGAGQGGGGWSAPNRPRAMPIRPGRARTLTSFSDDVSGMAGCCLWAWSRCREGGGKGVPGGPGCRRW